jgi:hypothetical protein
MKLVVRISELINCNFVTVARKDTDITWHRFTSRVITSFRACNSSLHFLTSQTRVQFAAHPYEPDTCTVRYTSLRAGHVYSSLHFLTSQTRVQFAALPYEPDTCTVRCTSLRARHVYSSLHFLTSQTRVLMCLDEAFQCYRHPLLMTKHCWRKLSLWRKTVIAKQRSLGVASEECLLQNIVLDAIYLKVFRTFQF